MSTHSYPRGTVASVLAVLLVPGLLLAGCGGSSNSASVSSTAATTTPYTTGAAVTRGVTTGAPKQAQPTTPAEQQGTSAEQEKPEQPDFTRSTSAIRPGREKDFRQAVARYAECLRQNGVQVSNSKTSGKNPLAGLGLKAGVKPSPQYREAQKKCSPTLFKALKSDFHQVSVPFTPAERRKDIAYASCMRKHGFDMHANFSGKGAIYEGNYGNTTPQFQTANKQCGGLG
jgi:hypothetical protein